MAGAGVIGKISDPHGERLAPLVYYLFGPGRREEHADPHIVAGWWDPAELEPPLRAGGRRDFRRLLGLLEQPHAAMGALKTARPVWHCALRAAPEDRLLSDGEWAQIAADVMDRTGLSPSGGEDDAVRWIAVRHGPDHVHIVAMLARQDRRRPRLSFERYKVRAACLAAEQRYGLRPTAPADRTAARCPARGEAEKASRRSLAEPPRVTLRRHVATAAATAGSDGEFFAWLETAGVQVWKRHSTTAPGQVTGYAVALPGDAAAGGGPVWYGGGKLAADLTWPKLRQRWAAPGTRPAAPLTTAERAAWDQAARAADAAAAHIRAMTGTGSGAASDAAWASGDILRAASVVLGSRVLRQAADAYDRAARPRHARIPAPTPAGDQLRRAARLIGALATVTHDPTLAPVVLVAKLAVLSEAVAGMHTARQRAAQAGAALTAARQLRAAATAAQAGQPPAQARAPAAAGLAALSFPAVTPGPGCTQPQPGQARPPATRGPAPPRPRGPRR